MPGEENHEYFFVVALVDRVWFPSDFYLDLLIVYLNLNSCIKIVGMIPENTEQKVLARKLQIIGYMAKLFCSSSAEICFFLNNIYCNNYSDNTSFLMPML